MKIIKIEIPDDYLTDLQKAADAADISLDSQVCVAIATWIALRTARGEDKDEK